MLTQAPVATAVLDAVDGAFVEHHARGAAPSAVWGVFDRQGLVRVGSCGELGDGTIPGPDTAYRIASCTKSFTATAVLALRDAGELNLDEPITRFVPDFSSVVLPSDDAPTPTIRMLLTMSAGLPTDDPWADRLEGISTDDLDSILRRGLSFESVPGTRFAYSNLGYALLGRVIEQAGGRPYRELVRELILEPLGLTGTGFDSSVAAGCGVANGNSWRGGRWHTLPFSLPGAFSPIGGLFSTITDLSRWARWLAEAFDLSASDQGQAPLSRASRREMQQAQRFVPNLTQHPTGYGFGLFVEHYLRGHTVISHSGGYPGFSSHLRWSSTSGLGVVAFENASYSRVSVPATEAFDLLNGSLLPNTPHVWAATRSAQAAVTALIREWSDGAAGRLFADNVPLDESFVRRRRSIARALTEIGGLDPVSVPTLAQHRAATAHSNAATTAIGREEQSTGPAHLVWYLPGRAGRLRVEILLNPENPPRVQTLKVSPDRVIV